MIFPDHGLASLNADRVAMILFHRSHWRMPLACAAGVGVAILSFVSVACAAQGPGASHGTAGSVAQFVMAIAVYGSAALVVGASLIVALRR